MRGLAHLGMANQKPITTAIRDLFDRSGLSREEIARLAGYRYGSAVQRYCDPDVFKRKWLPRDVAERLARALVGRGDPKITRDEVIALTGGIAPNGKMERWVALFRDLKANQEDFMLDGAQRLREMAEEASQAFEDTRSGAGKTNRRR